ELRSEEDGYDDRIYAEDNSEIDIRIGFEVVDVDGTDCASNISAKAKVYRWDATDDEWDYWKTTATQNKTLEDDLFSFTWSNEFNADDSYEEYKIEGIISEGSNELEIMDAYIEMEDNTCDGIELVAADFTMDEGDNKTRTFKIENNTNKDFDISSLSVFFSDALVSSGSVDYPNTVDDYTDEDVEVTLTAGYVSSTETTEGTFKVSGYLDGDFCSEGNVGRETFKVTVKDTGSNGNNGSGTSSDCDDLTINTKTITIDEGRETKEIFYLRNESTKRFELLDVDTTENGLELKSYYFEKYAFPGDIADIVIQAIAPNVTSNKTFENEIEVEGRFSDGKTCNFDDITKRSYDVYITDSSNTIEVDCGTITIDVPSEVNVINNATIPFTIQNNSNTRLDVILESTFVVDPAMISLPGNTSMSRDLFVSIDEPNGTITLRPNSACPAQTKTIKVINNASGTLSQVEMRAEIVADTTSILRISFNNHTNKVFTGVINADLDGIIINNKIISVPIGETISDIPLDTNNTNLNGIVTFTSNSEEISANIEPSQGDNGLFAGFFGLGLEMGGIAIILILVIIAIVLIVTLYEGTKYEEVDQPFVRTKQ
ncbi:MAG: hypothetical protein HN878_03930, partial [Candidatus Diapherotrites archaeon]|nr:hypothetical protein [Candidatus Diapherotrites archaeon]